MATLSFTKFRVWQVVVPARQEIISAPATKGFLYRDNLRWPEIPVHLIEGVTSDGFTAVGEADRSATQASVEATLRDLRAHGVDMVTIGQYLQPSAHHHPVMRYWTPGEFKALEDYGMALGFTHVASGPLVRSSYHADRQAAEAGVAA